MTTALQDHAIAHVCRTAADQDDTRHCTLLHLQERWVLLYLTVDDSIEMPGLFWHAHASLRRRAEDLDAVRIADWSDQERKLVELALRQILAGVGQPGTRRAVSLESGAVLHYFVALSDREARAVQAQAQAQAQAKPGRPT